MRLSQGLLASTLVAIVNAQLDGIDDAALRIASGFAATVIQHAVTTLQGDIGGDGNPEQMFDATNIDKPETGSDGGANNFPITQQPGGQPSVATYTHRGTLFPVTLLPHPVITIHPSSNDPYERIIQAYTGGADATTNQEITVAEPSGTKPGTIIVDVPGTAYSSFSSGQPGALTILPSNDNPTATIISALPSGVAITGDATRTVPGNGNSPATVIIQTPWADIPPSTIGAGAGSGAGNGAGNNGSDGGAGSGAGGDTGGEGRSDVLVIQTYTGTEYITQARVTTIAVPGGAQTKVVQVPGGQNPGSAVTIPPSDGSHFTTIIGPYTGATPILTPITTLIPTSAGNDGTIIIQTPNPSSTDSTGSEDGNLPENQPQIIPPSDDNPYSTILRPHDGPITKPITYTIPPSGTDPGTVIIETPAVRAGQQVITLPPDPNSGYITIVRQPEGVITAPKTITIAPTDGQPGTIVIETPAPTQSGDAEITIPPGADGSFITIIRSPTGTNVLTAPSTITITGAPGQPGTVIIETPGPSVGDSTITRGLGDPFTLTPGAGSKYITVFRPHSGDPISVPITLTQGGQDGQPGTIIIETPDPTSQSPGSGPITIPAGGDSPYVTIYKPHTGTPISTPTTITIPPSGTKPGTIIVETPTIETPIGQNAVTSTQTDSEQITIPPSKNNPYVTIYRPHMGDPITAPITITQSPSNGQPGTIIIETQGPVTINPTGPGGTATFYTPGTAAGTTITKITVVASGGSQSTAVIIETPPVKAQPTASQGVPSPGEYATVTSKYAGTDLTGVITTTVAGSGTNPGAVVIITPPGIKFNPTSDSPGSTVSGNDNYVTIYKPFPGPGIINTPITITQATPSGGQPGTVVIETPTAQTPATTPLPNPSTTQGSNGFVTVFLPFPGPGVITASYTRTLSGTVYITTPAPSSTSITPLPSPSTTQGPDGYVTVFLPFPGPGAITEPITSTQPPAGNQPGTVFITTPAPLQATSQQNLPSTTLGDNGYVTVFIPYPGPGQITAPITSTQPPSGGQPGTVFITTPPAPTLETPKQQNQLPSTTSGADGYVTVFLPFPGPGVITAPITSTQAPSGGRPGTVFITTPATPAIGTPNQQDQLTSTTSGADGYVTVFLPFPGPGIITAPITSTQAPSGGNPGTVFITTPAAPTLSPPKQQNQLTSTSSGVDGYVTVFLPFPGPGVITAPITRTQAPSAGNPGTVYITTPAPQTTPQDVHSTDPGAGQYVTVFFPFPGPGVITEPITRTQAAPSGGNPGTVFITTPAPPTPTQQTPTLTTDNYITIQTPFPGPGVITTPFTITTPPSSGQPGTIIIQTPAPVSSTESYVTVYRPYPGPGTITSPITLTQAPSNGQPGTVFIETQPISLPTLPTSASPITIPPNPTGTYMTVYRPYPGPGNINSPITYTEAPVSGQPGTVIIETPNPNANTATQTGPITVPTGDNNPYLTVYKPYPGPGDIDHPITITAVTPSGDQPGTIIIETPIVQVNTKFVPTSAPVSQPQSQATTKAIENPPMTIPQGQDGYVTVYQPHSGPGIITEPVTVSTVAPTNGQPGTVFIETPAPTVAATPSSKEQPTVSAVTIPAGNGGYVTVYRPYPGPGMITAPRTVGTVAPTLGQAGTVIIETPVLRAVASETTSPLIATSQGNDGYQTVFRPYTGTNVIAQPITVTTIAPSAGQPGTVVIETPVPLASTSAQGSNDAPVTIPPGPGSSYATVYRPHTGVNIITAPVTISTIAGVNGQPDTVIVETPAQSPPVIATTDGGPVTIPAGPSNSYATVYRPHTGADIITTPVTISTIAGVNGQPGTVIVETPTAQSQAVVAISDQGPVTIPAGPGNSYATIFRAYTGTGAIAQPVFSTIPGLNGQPGTVVIETPAPLFSTPGQAGINTPITIPTGPDNSYATIYRPHTGINAITAPIISTIPGVNGQPGTVVVETPVPLLSASAPVGINAPVTVPPGPDNSYATIYRPHTGIDAITAPITSTIPGMNGQPGTVIVETPVAQAPASNQAGGDPAKGPSGSDNSYATVYRPHTGVNIITAPVTISTIAGVNGQPGTVIVETPDQDLAPIITSSGPGAIYITVYQPCTGTQRITEPVTVTTIPPINNKPGTVIIETPGQQAPATTYTPDPASYVTVTKPHTGTGKLEDMVTTTIPPQGDQPGTVIIGPVGQQALTPVSSVPSPGSYVTITRPYSGSGKITEPVTTTVPAQGAQPGTVIVETPGQATAPAASNTEASYVSISRPYTGTDQITAPVVTTVPPRDGQPGTVIFETQAPFATIYRPYTGSGQITGPVTVSTIAPVGDKPGTVVVETPGGGAEFTTTPPAPSYVTSSVLYTGIVQITAPTALTTIRPQGNQPGTVIMGTPGSYATSTTLYMGPNSIRGPTALTTIQPQGTQAGVVVIAIPPYTTITGPYTGTDQITAPVTVTAVSPQGDKPGTVVIETQAPFATIYRPYTGPGRITAATTVSTISPSGNQPGTVIVETPGSEPPVTTTPPSLTYTTVYEQYSGTDDITEPRAKTTIEPQAGQPGTVIFETPGQRFASTSAAPSATYVNIYQPHTGPDSITAPVTISNIPPQGGQPGTYIIETPGLKPAITSIHYEPSFVTIYQPHAGAGTITEPATVTTLPPQGGQPGTVVIETPGSGSPLAVGPSAELPYKTVYQPHTGPGQITAAVTITTIPPQGGQPGTVVIETPGLQAPTTVGPEPSYVVVSRPYTGTEQITAPITVTTIAPQGGQPGTVIVETPELQSVTGSTPATTSAPGNGYVTIYRPYTGTAQITAPITITTTAPGSDTGTVVIETLAPTTASVVYVTIYKPYTGINPITEPTTTTIAPVSGTGTVLIETPTTVPTMGSQISNSPVITIPPSNESHNTTIIRPYSGTEPITAPITKYVPPTATGEPGTIVIETPPVETTTGAQPSDATPSPAQTNIPSGDGIPNVTVVREHTGVDTITAPLTRYEPPSGSGQPGTVIIETPASKPASKPVGTNVTVYTLAPPGVKTPFTSYEPPKNTGDPGTVFIETVASESAPMGANVTITREEYSGFLGPFTTYLPPGASGDPGTFIIELPAGRPSVITSDGPAIASAHPGSLNVTIVRSGTGSQATTIFVPPSGSEAGTVIIETPVSSPEQGGLAASSSPMTGDKLGVTIPPSSNSPNVTVIKPYPGPGSITEPITRYIPPTAAGEPGTIIIETNASDSPGPMTNNPKITLPPTSQSPNTTIIRPYTGPGSITEPITRYIPPTAAGEPGTIVIETQSTDASDTSTAARLTDKPSAITLSASPGSPNITIISGVTGPEVANGPVTRYIEPTKSGEPGTVLIETPAGPASMSAMPTTPKDSMGPTSSNVNAITLTPSDGNNDVTILEPNTRFPDAVENVTQIIPPSNGNPGTKIIYTPVDTSSVQQASPGASGTASYVTVSATITIPGDPSTRTGVRSSPGAEPTTTGAEINTIIIPPSGTELGTVVLQTSVYLDQTLAEHGNVTITRAAPSGITKTLTTYAPPAVSTDPGTFIIEVPDYNVTITRTAEGSITDPFTTYAPPASAGEPGTIIVEIPGHNLTLTRPAQGTVTAPVTKYLPPATLGDPGTVIVETPSNEYNTTITREATTPITGRFTTYLPPASQGDPGTVIVEVPGNSATTGSGVSLPASGTSEPGVAATGPGNTTIYSGVSGNVVKTIYFPPTASGERGTVVVETPAGSSGRITGAELPTSTATSGRTNTTIYTAGSGTARTTQFIPASAPGESDTVLIQTPATGLNEGTSSAGHYITTVFSGGAGTATRTTIISATGPGQPDTMLVLTPTGGAQETSATQATGSAKSTSPFGGIENVTISRGGPGSVLTTIYEPATASGEPGTVIIETPTGSFETPKIVAAGTNVTAYSDGPLTATRTIYLPPTASGDAGTVLIETPDGSIASQTGAGNITIYTGISGTATKTRFIPATVTGEPGTILIETPTVSSGPQTGVGNVTIYTGIAGTTARTTFIPGSASGEPGTVMVETPTGPADSSGTGTAPGNVTVYTGYSGSATETRYIPPTKSGEAGTIIIETPTGHSSISGSSTGTSISPQQRENTTVYTGGPGTVAQTKYVPATASNEPDTILIQTPTTGIDTGSGISAPISGAAKSNVTIYSGGSGTATSPIYLPPASSGEAGTVIILTPIVSADSYGTVGTASRETGSGSPSPRNVTVTRAAPGSITSMYTTYMPPGTPGDPGTVIVETPDYNVTITRQAPASVTSVRMSYMPPGTIGDPGTVIMETPNNAFNITITRAAPATVIGILTTYAPPATPGDPGTIIIETPDNNVTITRQAPASITSPITRYAPPGTPGDPGTVIVETPNNDYNVTITRAAPTSVTYVLTTYAPPGTPGDPGTIIVETPVAVNNAYNVTITRAAPASVKSMYTTYVPPGASGDPGTVIVETPAGAYNVTTTRGATVTAPFTTYIAAASPGDPGTILVETPDYNTTITRQAPISVTSLRTVYNPPGNIGDPGTVIIETPRNVYNITITTGASITAPTTKYSPPATPGDPGTVIVETPDYNVTVTRQGPKSVTTVFSTYVPPGSPGDPGTVIIETPVGPYNVTTTQGGSTITAPLTTYLPPKSPGDPGTVLVETPEYNVTVTSQATGSALDTVTRYNPPASPGDPGTVAIIIPNQRIASTSQAESSPVLRQNTTIYRAGPRTLTGPVTSFIPPQSAGDSGTVIIETPGPATPFNVTTTQTVRTITAIHTTFLPASTLGDPGTVLVEVPPERNVTVTQQGATITAAYTSYLPPGAAGDPGTVIVGIPADRNVSITSIDSTRTVPYTTYLPPSNRGDPGTVLVELPPNSNITTTKTVSDRTAPFTTYLPPGSIGDPGTLFVEVPLQTQRNVTVTNIDSSITSDYTSYSPPVNPGDPGTVFIGIHPDSNITITTTGVPGTILVEVPPLNNVTITTQVAGLTAPLTAYSPPANAGDPGTVIVELPPDSTVNVTTTKVVSSRTAVFTTYSAPANRGDPGTVIIEIPPSYNVTITTEVVGLTAPYTTYSPAASAGGPGTIIVKLPPARNTTVTTQVASLTVPYTTYAAPAKIGDPGTVIVEIPPDRNTTITTTVATRTTPYTKFASPSNIGDPGTVIVEMPPDRNVTVTTEVPTITQLRTVYAAPANKGDPGTVFIELPPPRNTTVTTTIASLTTPYTTYSAPGSQGDPGTIIVEMPPERNITTTQQGVSTITRIITTYLPPTNPGDPGTIVVEIPAETNTTVVEVVSTLTRPATRFVPPATPGDPGTVYLDVPPSHTLTMTTTVSTISRPTTVFKTPATEGDAATVLVEMPPEYNVTTTATFQSISRVLTRYSTPAVIGDPGTVFIDLPPEYNVTVTTTIPTITRQSTTFAPAATQGDPGTIIIEMPPAYNITTTQTVQTISRPATRYSSPAVIGDPGTIFVLLPPEYNVTVTTTINTITRPTTAFVSADMQGDPGTILVELPPASNVTTTQTVSTITRPTTRYSSPGTLGDPGTVYVDLPPEYNITVTKTISTITKLMTTFASPGMQGDPGTVIVELPPDSNVTISSTVPTISRPATRFASPAGAGDPGTVYIDLPPDYNVTTTATISSITRVRTTYNPGATQGDPGTVIVQVPVDYNLTTTQTVSTISRVQTTYYPAGIQGDPNTVMVQVPPSYNVTSTQTVSTISRIQTSYYPAGVQGDPNTVIVQVPPSYNITTTQTIPTITQVSTIYAAPANEGDPGTILVEVPPSRNITTTQTISTISQVLTSYYPAANLGDANTVLVQVPVDHNITVTQTVATISRATTIYNPPATQGDPGTILVELPPAYNVTTTQTVPTITRVASTYASPANLGDPGTIIIQIPPSYNITITQTVPTISRVATVYDPPAVQGDPGTIIVEVPPSYNITTTQTVPTISRVATVYSPPAVQGDPGTIIIEVPPSYNVTTTQTVPTISRVATVYNPPAVQGDPGTIIIEVPPSYNVTTTQTVPTISQVATTYNAPAVQGDPGTVIVQMPPAYNVTSTQTVATINQIMTSFVPATAPGSPGTVLIQVPPPISSTLTTIAAPISSSPIIKAIQSTSTTSKMPQASFGPTFDCDGYGYTISTLLGNTLTQVNLNTGQRTTIKSGIGPGGTLLNVAGASGAINAIGFNKLDYYIYGIVNQGLVSGVLCGLLGCPSSQLIRIAKNGAYEALSLTIPSNMIDMGDVDDQGRFWVAENGKKWWCIDVNPASSTFGKLLSSGTSAIDIISGVGDWAYVPGGGDYLYAVQASVIESGLLRTNIVRWSRTTHIWERYQSYPNLVLTATNLVWGAVMAGPNTLWAQENLLGQTWRFTLGSTADPTPIPGGSILNLQGDGARCPDAKTVFGPPFTCNGNGYVMSNLLGNTLTEVNLNDGSRATVANGIGPGIINGIGYNTIDNYIYGMVVEGISSSLIRVAQDGAYEILPLTIPSIAITMGDVDNQGRLWVSESGKRWWCIDVNPSSSTFSTLLNSGTSAADILSGVGDWAYIAGAGSYLYAVQASVIESGLLRTNIVRWSLTTQTWERYQSYSNFVLTSLNLEWGAVMGGPGGTLYAQENLLGQTWKFTLGSTANPTSIPGSTILNLSGDGARCVGLDPTNINLPPSTTVTVTTTIATISQVMTTLALPGTQGGPATAIVQVPAPYNITTTQTVSTLTRATTVYLSATAVGSPGTILVQYPLPYTVTITTNGGTTITAPVTSLQPPGQAGDPATVIIATPSSPPAAATSSASSQPALKCDSSGYLIQKTALYRVDLTTGKTTLINALVGPGGNINAIGYNKFDNFIYGMLQDATGTQVIRIAGDGSYTLLSARTSDRNVNMGDIDNLGRYWIGTSAKAWWCIDLMPGSTTYGKIIMSGTAITTLTAADWAFVPGGGDYMYAIMVDSAGLISTLSRFSRTSYTWSTVKAYGSVAGSNFWGAVYASQDGNLYGSENNSGQIFKFPIAPTTGSPVFIATGPASSQNDGARCIDSQNLPV
ncbi:hypothetical protein FBEOM_12868 [Fusarium beomiforme]|uniref:DUF6923 domain-containing protein n=1 Tax=Fusarium beomiforme TaxID=44412 RepID=A0A9P5DSM1_9HYPO|nr:hypothetical protein FBEOM_12868 [Fusarium beomiforme]